jgi:hypothetical protein
MVEEIPAAELAVLRRDAEGDPLRLARWLKRRRAGEPLAYVRGVVEFRGRRFKIDRRAFVTEPENAHLIDAVVEAARARGDGWPRLAAEVGVGCGSLAVSLALELPGTRLVGLEINDAALELARENAALHGVELDLLASDLFAGWDGRPPPDLVFGDPPWGDDGDDTAYAGTPPTAHFLQMPVLSALPAAGRTAVHREILDAVRERGWRTEVFLNCGCLPDADVDALGRRLPWFEVLRRAPGATVLHGRT